MMLPLGTLCMSVTAHTSCFSGTFSSCLVPSLCKYGVEVGEGVTDSDLWDCDLYPELDGLNLHDNELVAESNLKSKCCFSVLITY